jgi:hypothetical protein
MSAPLARGRWRFIQLEGMAGQSRETNNATRQNTQSMDHDILFPSHFFQGLRQGKTMLIALFGPIYPAKTLKLENSEDVRIIPLDNY